MEPVDSVAEPVEIPVSSGEVSESSASVEVSDSVQPEGGLPDEPPSPLSPQGDRFKQVWARAKDAEFKLQSERERAARLEGELHAIREVRATPPPTPAEKEYTWRELQTAIDAGQITLAQAQEHREGVIRRELERTAKDEVRAALDTSSRVSTVQTEINQYRQIVPEATQPGTPERAKLEKEFSYLLSIGYDQKDPRTELLAARTAFGDLDSAKSRKEAKGITSPRATMQDVQTTNGKPAPTTKDPIAGLSAEQKKHYQRMIDRGVYPKGWEDVKAELAWEKPR